MTARPTSWARARTLFVVLVAMLVVLVSPQQASAHTDFDSSEPADGAVVEGPLTEVVLNFTNPAVPAGDEFELLDPAGEIRLPTTVDETDGTTFVLTFDPALTAGTYGLRWQVQAGDAHPIDGSFRFEVTGPATTTAAPATTSAPVTTSTPTAAPATTQAADAATPATTTIAPTTTSLPDDAAAALEAFLDDDGGSGDDGTALGRVGRTLTALGLLFGLGTVAALVWVIRGRRHELLTQLSWVRLTGVVVMAGGMLELAALHAAQSGSVVDLLDTKAGVAAALKIIGGVAVLIGFHAGAGRLVAGPRSLSSAVAAPPEVSASVDHDTEAAYRWVPTSTAWLGLGGFAAVLASYWFDGHTVSQGVWALHAVVNLVHLGAAAVWAGGVFAMTTVVWMRRRAGEQTGLASMIVRFSTLAAASLTAVIVAGVAMAAMILDGPGDLLDTEWGRLLLAKTAVVAVAAGLGAFNHFRLRPALEQRPDDPALAKELRVSLTIESIAFVAAVVLTSWLVAAAI